MKYISWSITNNRALYDYKFNIVDKTGKEIVKGKRWLCGTEDFTITFTGIKPDVMDLIDNEQAFINLQTVYLEYGHYNKADDQGSRTFIKNFPEVELGVNKVLVKKSNNTDIAVSNFDKAYISFALNDYFKTIPGRTYKAAKTEVTQSLYETVMGQNPSMYKDSNLPVTDVSLYDAIYFCNKLSVINGKEPVYSVGGFTDITRWNYTPGKKKKITEKITQNLQADDYRLPLDTEWEYAARGGETFNYAGSDNIDEVAWYYENSSKRTHPVAQKKANGYGLYDMCGNVREWIWGNYKDYDNEYQCCGGCWYDDDYSCKVGDKKSLYAYSAKNTIGLRLLISAE